MLTPQSSKKKPSLAPAHLKKQQIPLQDLNFISRNNSNTSFSSSSSSSSSSMSTNPPKGCLHFFLSNPSPISRSKENNLPKGSKPSSQKSRKNPPCLYQWQSGKKPTSKSASKSNLSQDLDDLEKKQQCGFKRVASKSNLSQECGLKMDVEVGENCTHVGKLESCKKLTSKNASKSDIFQDMKDLEQKQPCGFKEVASKSNLSQDLRVLEQKQHEVSENCTPVGKLEVENSNSDVTYASCKTKTPPIQDSVSPEIQCGSSMQICTTTPTCYGAGHVVSGVTDRRKCRPRGVLTVGGFDSSISSKPNVFESGNGENHKRVLRNSLVPLPIEASMSWLLSPHDNDNDKNFESDNGGNDKRVIKNSLICSKDDVCEIDNGGNNKRVLIDSSRTSLIPLPVEASMNWLLSPHESDVDSAKGLGRKLELDLDSSPTSCYGFGSNLGNSGMDTSSLSSYNRFCSDLRNGAKFSGMGTDSPSSCHGFGSNFGDSANSSGMDTSNTDSTTSKKTRITLLSPRVIPEFQGFDGISSEKMCRHSSSASPRAAPSCKLVHSQGEKKSHPNDFCRENSPFSMGSLSSGNVIQTPKSDSSSERHFGLSWLNSDTFHKNNFEFELDSIAEVLKKASVSPDSIDLSQFQRTLDNRASWVSNSSTMENASQSQMRISWREGLASRIFEMDEFDCCRCLSDEENEHLEKSPPTQKFDVDVQDDDCLKFNNGLGSPEFLEHELGVDEREKSKLFVPNSLEESISTDGGGLIASGDSDWSLCYKNHLFKL